MNIEELYNLVKEIVKEGNLLKNKYTDEVDAKVNYACIFCQNDIYYDNYVELLKKDNNIIIGNTITGPIFRIKDLETVSGLLKLLKIRKYDAEHLELGDADFTINDYELFKNKYLDKHNFKLISKVDYEMIELMEDGNNVRVYFSNPPIDQELKI